MYKTLILILFAINYSFAQNIDSVVVRISQTASDSHGFAFSSADVDSFASGKLIDSINFDHNWQINHHYSDSFDINGNLVMENSDWYNPSFHNNYHVTYSYNGLNLLTDELKLYPPANPHSIHYTYNSQNLTVQVDDSVLINNIWKPAFLKTISYDTNDSIIEEITMRWFNVMWIEKERHRYAYQANLRTDTLMELDSASGNRIYKQLITKFSFNSVDTMILYQNFNRTTQNWDSSFMKTYLYSFAPLRLSQWATYMYSSGWVLSDGEELSYDTLFRLVHIHNIKPDLCQNDEYFSYNADGSPDIYTYDQFCPNSFFTLKTDYYYSGGLFNIMIPEQMDICSADSVQIRSANIMNSSNLQYQWSPSVGLSNDTILNPYVFVDTTTTYELIVTDSIGNSDTLQMLVNVKISPPLDPVILSLDTILPCFSFTLSADSTNSYPGIYEWYFNGALLDVPFGGNEATHNLNGVFTITATANNGCIRTDSLVMNLMPTQSFPIIPEDACNNYLFTAFPGGEYYEWVWDGIGVGFGLMDTFNVLNIGSSDMAYYVIVKDSSGCNHWSEPVWTKPKSYNSSIIKEGCGGQCDATVLLNLNDRYSPHSIIWSTGDTTSCTNCTQIIHTGHCSGHEWAEITDVDGCIVVDSFIIAPNPHTLSVATQIIPDPGQACTGSIQVNALSSDTTTNSYLCINDTVCSWFHNDTLLQNLCWGTYYITLYNNGCYYTDSIRIDSLALFNLSFTIGSNVLYPNPANNFTNIITNSNEPFDFILTTVSGKELLHGTSELQEYQLDCNQLEDGIYYIRIMQNEKQSILKLLIIH